LEGFGQYTVCKNTHLEKGKLIMMTAEQAKNAQQTKQAELAKIAIVEAQLQAEKNAEEAKALAESNLILSKKIFDKAQKNIERASAEGKSEVTFFAGYGDSGAYAIASDLLKKLGFHAVQVFERVEVPMYDSEMQGMRDYNSATGDMKVSWE
jgi:hypothetical protein